MARARKKGQENKRGGAHEMLNHFSTKDVSNILGIKAGRLRYWNRIGLVKPSIHQKGRHSYNFHDLICLKAAQGLISQGLQATKMKRSVESLRKKFPELEDHWAGKRLYVFGSRAVISHQDNLMETQSGQLLFKFNLDKLAKDLHNQVKDFRLNKTAEDWFSEGLVYDSSEETCDLALQAYREAVKLNPNFSDAYINMGNVFYHQRKYAEAAHYYRFAIEAEPDNAQAYFNLGNTLDAVGPTEEAVECYQRSLDLDSSFSEVHYNLAAACEKLELWKEAFQHWTNFLKWDSFSPQADFARKRIRLLKSNLALN
jgi:tetratricopeptide (TPR) repeat protein